VTFTKVESQHEGVAHQAKQARQKSVDYLKHWAKQLKVLIEGM
jgi:hypothetical protein